MHSEITLLYLFLDNRHRCRSACVCVRVCIHMFKYTMRSHGCVFLQERILIWFPASKRTTCCGWVLVVFSAFFPALLGPHLDKSLYILLLYKSLLRHKTTTYPWVGLMAMGAHRSRLVTQTKDYYTVETRSNFRERYYVCIYKLSSGLGGFQGRLGGRLLPSSPLTNCICTLLL